MASSNQRNAASKDGDDQAQPKTPAKRGFAAMDQATQRSIASKGRNALRM